MSLPEARQLHQEGRLADAERAYRRVLASRPDDVDAQHLLGVLLLQTGRAAEGAEMIGRAAQREPERAEFQSDLGVALRAAGRDEAAVNALTRAAALAPHNPDARFNLGLALLAVGRHDEAAAELEHAAALEPRAAEPRLAVAHACLAADRIAAAIPHLEQAIALGARTAAVLNDLGTCYKRGDELDRAEACYRQAVALDASVPDAHYNLGNVLWARSEFAAAEKSYREALRLRPAWPDAIVNLGNARRALGEVDGPIALYEQALALDPRSFAAAYGLGAALELKREHRAALVWYGKALELVPDSPDALEKVIRAQMHLCDWSDLEGRIERLRTAIRSRPARDVRPFSLLAMPGVTPREQLLAARAYARERFGAVAAGAQPLHRARRAARAGRRLRIGYLSYDFREHPVAQLVAELIELHDRARFEVIGLSHGPDDGSPMRARLRRAFDGFVLLEALATRAAAERIAAEEIDILIDLMGYTEGNRVELLAFRAAPVQAAFLCYTGTVGSPVVEWLVADRVVLPESAADDYDETIAYLPVTYQCTDRKRPVGPPPSRRDCGLPERAIVLCCHGQSYKITPQVFAIWCGLLRAHPEAVLWLLAAGDAVRENLLREAQARGVSPDRIVFAPRVTPAQHLGRLQVADLFLDTLPYNAHTFASDALWAGLPLVTCAGDTFPARVAASLLNAVGLPELVTTSLADYAALADRLVGNPDELRAVRAKLAAARENAPLFDTAPFARDREALYETMWARYVAGG